jgi:hypothetical protein
MKYIFMIPTLMCRAKAVIRTFSKFENEKLTSESRLEISSFKPENMKHTHSYYTLLVMSAIKSYWRQHMRYKQGMQE